MATDPLSLVTNPNPAPASQPGLFDGQLTPVEPVANPAPITEPEPVEVAGVGSKIFQKIVKGKVKTTKRLEDVANEAGHTAGQAGNYTVIREATPDEVMEFSTLTGKTSGAPSPTAAQRAMDIPTAEFNLENIDGPDALKETIDNVAEMWKDAGRAAGRGTMTFNEIQGLAKDMGLEKTVDRLMNRKTGSTMNAEEIAASLQAIATSGMELNRLAKIAANSTDAADLLKFRQHLSFHSALQINMKGAQMEAGRALAAFRIPRGVGSDIDAQALQDLMGEFGGQNSVRDMAKSYLALPTQAQRNKFSYGAWDKVRGSWFEVWINGLLSAPPTHFANMSGNTIFQLIQLPERAGAGLIGLARQAMGSKADRVYMEESLAEIVGMFQGVGDGFRLAGEAWRTEAPVRDVVGKIESAQRHMITGQNLAPDAPDFIGKGIDYLGAGVRLPGRALMSEDEFFKAVAYRREINAQAVRIASKMKRNGAHPVDIADAVDDVLAGRNTEAMNAAEDFAQYSTFTNPVHGDLGKLGAAVQGSTLGRFMVPFFKTIVNIAKAAGERSPYGFVKAIANAGDPIKRDMLIARATLGTSAMAYAGLEYTKGNITGSGPTNSSLRRQLEDLGWKRWSFVSPKEGVENPRWIQVGHMYIQHPEDVDYVSYHRLEPASMLLAVAADVTERFRWPTATQEEGEDIMMSAVDVVFDYMKDQTFMKGFANIAGILAKRTGTERNNAVSRVIQDLVGSQVPYSSLLASIERVMDPLQDNIIPDRNEPMGLRDLYAGIERMEQRLPWAEKDGPLLRDRFGNPRIQKGAHVREVLLPPFMADILGEDVKKIESDPVLLEVVAAGVPLTMPDRKIDGVPLTAEEYDTMIRFASNPPDMPSFYSALSDLVNTKSFKASPIPDRQVLIKGLDADYKAIAKSLILDAPEYQEQFADLREKVAHHREIIEAVGRQIQ